MARKSDRRKGARSTGSSGGGGGGGGGSARGGKGIAKAKPSTKTTAKPAPAAPAPAKIKFHGKLLENEPLARHTTWRIGGPARYLALPADTEEAGRALQLAQERGAPWLGLGPGAHVAVK